MNRQLVAVLVLALLFLASAVRSEPHFFYKPAHYYPYSYPYSYPYYCDPYNRYPYNCYGR